MAGQFQKLRILYLRDFLLRQTDEQHPVTLREMQAHLETRGITAERKSIYDDLEALRFYGMDIVQTGGSRSTAYYAGARDFELPELKLMVDSVQSSKFITESKTVTLIRKLESLASMFDAQLLRRQVYVKNRIKSMNESIYYNVDTIHSGLAQNRQITFHYFEYTVQKERRLRHDGALYRVSPFALTWDDENYYLVGYDAATNAIRHYREDKMLDIRVTEDPRDGEEEFRLFDMAAYAKKVFGMFSGEEQQVKLRFKNHLVGAVIDRFGKEVMLIPDGDEHFTVTVSVVVSPQFFGWLCGFGGEVRIEGPEDVREQFRKLLAEITGQY